MTVSTERKTPPIDETIPLATLERADGFEELRVGIDTYQGRSFVRLHVWHQNSRREWWPRPGKFATIRQSELIAVRDALNAAIGVFGLEVES